MEYRTIPAVSLGQAWTAFWANLFNFSGRATRAEYWWIALLVLVLNSVIAIPLLLLPVIGSTMLSVVVAAFTLALYVRRFHDVGLATWVAVTAIVSQLVLTAIGFALLTAGFLPSISEETFNPDALNTNLLALGGLALALALAVNAFVLIVTLLPSKADNQYGPQRAGRVLVQPHGQQDTTAALDNHTAAE